MPTPASCSAAGDRPLQREAAPPGGAPAVDHLVGSAACRRAAPAPGRAVRPVASSRVSEGRAVVSPVVDRQPRLVVRRRQPARWGGTRGVGATGQDVPMNEPQPAPAEAREQHRELTEEIEEARWRYFVLDNPTLDDADYDQRLRRLQDARGGVPRAAHPRLADPEGRRRGVDRVHRGRPPPADGEPRQRVLLRRARDLARPARRATASTTRPCCASSRSTGWRSTCSTRTAA